MLLSCLNKETSTLKVVLFSREGRYELDRKDAFGYRRVIEESYAATWRVLGCIINPQSNIVKKGSHLELFSCIDGFGDGLQIFFFFLFWGV